ncbi:hypothetical protein DPMN_098154 [Dreissena polymorpha]|uniref:Transmembrane protein n=1 Tax=Dreissena polymorpha TaxID=45954 RepID=A0A9D4R707_DREPO|nr:hypothetical protein DPMN_098154 [Dreissena polymorpha]
MVSAVLCEDNIKILCVNAACGGIRYVCDKAQVYDVYDSCEEDDGDGKMVKMVTMMMVIVVIMIMTMIMLKIYA